MQAGRQTPIVQCNHSLHVTIAKNKSLQPGSLSCQHDTLPADEFGSHSLKKISTAARVLKPELATYINTI